MRVVIGDVCYILAKLSRRTLYWHSEITETVLGFRSKSEPISQLPDLEGPRFIPDPEYIRWHLVQLEWSYKSQL